MSYSTYRKIQTVTVTATTAAAMEFTSIPQTFDDLQIFISARTSRTADIRDDIQVTFNANTSNYSVRVIRGSGSAAISQTGAISSALNRMDSPSATATGSTFGSVSIYVPNYTSNNNKSVSIDATMENNATESYMYLNAGLWSNTSAITSITLKPEVSSFVTNSTATLYGIKRA